MITGVLVEPSRLRYSPAGIPIARFLLEHDSEQCEAGRRRALRLRVGVRAAGRELAEPLEKLPAGAALRVTGHLVRARQQTGDSRLIISASRIERLD